MDKKAFKAVGLRRLDEDTVNQIRNWRNAEFVREQSYTNHKISEEEHKTFIEKLKNDPNRDLFVFYLNNDPFAVYSYTMNCQNNSVVVNNYLTNEDFKYMGYGAIMSYFIQQINFKILNVHKQCGEIISTNRKFIARLKKDGKIIEGILREHALINGEYYDVYVIGILEEDFIREEVSMRRIVHSIVKEEPIENCVFI